MIIEVFKTNVEEKEMADKIVDAIHGSFENYKVNFDLHDCDRILRVVSMNGCLDITELICFINKIGYDAEVLAG